LLYKLVQHILIVGFKFTEKKNLKKRKTAQIYA